MDCSTPPHIDVVAGIIVNDRNQVLLAKRPEHLDQGGLWEFPGGKREAGENSINALVRELYEELDIVIESALPTMTLSHEYPQKTVNLEFFEISKWRGVPRGKEGQSIRWAAKNELTAFDFPAANVPVLGALRFPRVILCASADTIGTELLKNLEHCLATGLSTIVLTVQQFSPTEIRQCVQVYRLCEKYDGQLILDCDLEHEKELILDFPKAGLYVKLVEQNQYFTRPSSGKRLLACECHSLDDLNLAIIADADVAFLSPVGFADVPRLEAASSALECSKQPHFPLFALCDSSADGLSTALNGSCYGVAVNVNGWLDDTFQSIESYVEKINAALDVHPSAESSPIR